MGSARARAVVGRTAARGDVPVWRPIPPRRRRIRGYTLRELDRSDLPVLLRHRLSMFVDIGNYREGLLRRHLVWYRPWVLRMRRAHRFHAWGWETRTGEVVASGSLWLWEGRPHPVLGPGYQPYVLSMYTDPAHRGKGLGREIVAEMMRWARDHGFGRIVLHASAMGRPVYASLGFADGVEMTYNLPLHAERLAGRRTRRRARR